jgi:hypothetical protein
MLTITASAKPLNGRIDPRLESGKILVSIKKGGAKICGSYTSSSAPSANFTSATKVWSGNNAVSLLGQDCTLPPGEYEFCVQFFGQGRIGLAPLSEEKCKSFTVRPVEQQNYQPPQAISPTDGTIFKEIDLKKPINFRWTPVVPKPQEPVTYRIKVWQLMQGQNGMQAMRSNQPLIERDVKGQAQAIVSNIIDGPCKPPYMCDFVWNVQALDRDGKPIGGNNGTSEAIKFTVQPVNDPPSILKLLMPKNGSILSENENPKFTWTIIFHQDAGEESYYKLKIVEIKGDQSPEDAFATNKPHFERDSLIRPSFEYPTSAPKFESEKKYAWRVQAFRRDRKPVGENGISETFVIRVQEVNDQPSMIKLLTPENGSILSVNDRPNFTWKHERQQTGQPGTYKIKIVEIKGDQSPEDAFATNKPHFEKDSLVRPSFEYPTAAPKFKEDARYVWAIESKNQLSALWTFTMKPAKKSTCESFKVQFTPIVNPAEKNKCCYNITITNRGKETGITGFRINTNGYSFISIDDAPKPWDRKPIKLQSDTKEITWTYKTGNISQGRLNLGMVCLSNITTSTFYIVYEWLDKNGRAVCKDSVQVKSCVEENCRGEIIRNGGFITGNQPGIMPSPGAIQYWSSGYGSPVVNNDPNEGFIEQGYVMLTGNKAYGQAVAQTLDLNNKIIQGKKYKLSVAVRFKAAGSTLNYVKLRAIAFNGSIFSTTGSHPMPGADVAIIGRSGKILDCGDWAVVEFTIWTAGKDFSNIAIHAFTNDNTNALVWIDNVSLCETLQGECDEVQTDEKGAPIMPSGYGNLPAGTVCETEPEEDEYYNGALVDLYKGYDGTSSLYTSNALDCFNIGGTLPEEVNNYNCDDSLKAAGVDMTCEELQKLLQQEYVPDETKKLSLPPIGTITDNKCDRPQPANMASMPFHGRDIIYIHGLQLSHIIDRAKGTTGATGQWPANQNEYYSGYYNTQAMLNMYPHIDHFLRNRGHKNRVLIVSYDCSQSAELAIHTVLTQIREAMQTGEGVMYDPSDLRGKNCFGRDYIFLSHSTGALIADVVLSIANKTKTNTNFKTKYGDIGLISDRCKGRVSIQGAYSGSNLAKIACIAAQNSAFTSTALTTIAITALMGSPLGPLASLATLPSTSYLNSILSLIPNSILVDLVPSISVARWGSYINDISVPVFTLAGGHPSAILWNLKYNILDGFDDGVLTMDCANANKNPLSLGPSCFFANPIKVFDMGILLTRGIKYFLDRRVSPGVFAAASTVYLSPTGMVEPVSSIILEPQNHYDNHYSFLQSAKQHWFNATESSPSTIDIFNNTVTIPGTACAYVPTKPQLSINNEEVLVVTNPNLFTPGLIDPSIISQMGETQKDQHIYYPWAKIVYRHGFPRLSIYWKKFYIWKRTYHKLNDNCMYDVDYVYKYLFKQ